MSRIAFIHNALGKTDGVSLEVDKWKKVCERQGHTVFYIAGNHDVEGIHCIEELSFNHALSYKILRNATVELKDYESEAALEQDIYRQKNTIKQKLAKLLEELKIDIIIPNNLMSVGYHIPALLAIAELIDESGIRTICHNHDFYFEDSGEVHPTCRPVKEILEKYAPPVKENVTNIVINQPAQKELWRRKHIQAQIVPNVFDFSAKAWERDDYNADLREYIGITPRDIMVLQATRILDRKGVELAIDLVAEMNSRKDSLYGRTLYNGEVFDGDAQIVLVCGGYIEKFGISGDYHKNLLCRAKDKNVDIRFIGERIRHSRGEDAKGKLYSLWDCYAEADLITYPSIWEGWGNQFIEAVFAKLPIVLYEYPVFVTDLKDKGFLYVSLGEKILSKDSYGLVEVSSDIIERAAKESIALLLNKEKRQKYTENNYRIAERLYSLEALEKIVREMVT